MIAAALRTVALPLVVALIGSSGVPSVHMQFNGHWQVVRGIFDGRTDGASARSFHPGDALNVAWEGRTLRIFGVTGPTGGHALIVVPHQPPRTIDFYSPRKRAHALVYQSAELPDGPHFAALVTLMDRDARSRGTYVNIDDVEAVDPR